jgi:hypothetical protein
MQDLQRIRTDFGTAFVGFLWLNVAIVAGLAVYAGGSVVVPIV